jgi:hypothetical protein
MAEAQPRRTLPGILVLPSSRAASRELGPLAWLVLEGFALQAEAGGTLVAETSVRTLAAEFGVGKEAAATALGRLIDFGLVRCNTRRPAGRYAGSSYILDADACRRAGVVITTGATEDSPCTQTPCPVRPDTAERATAQRDTAHAGAVGTEPVSRSAASRGTRHRIERSVAELRDATEQSLFDFSDQSPTSPTPEPLSPTSLLPSTTPALPTSRPDFPSSSLLPLTPSSQPDALAPGVRPGRVNVAGNRAGERSGLNGNLNAETRSC